jgi:CBS domain-containing protein
MVTRSLDPRNAVAIREATVRDAMSSGIVSCTPDTPLRKVAQLMAENRMHGIFVFDYGVEDDETTELWGLVSDLDVVAATRGDIDTRTAGDSAVTPLVTVPSDVPLDRAAQLLAESGASHLAVVDPLTRRPIGVLSTLDIVRAVAVEPTGSRIH